MVRSIFIGFVCLSLSATSQSDDWLQWRGPLRNGIAPNQNPPLEWGDQKNIVWQVKIPGRGHSSPIVVGERIYLTTANEAQKTQSVVCFDRRTGAVKWEKEVHRDKFATRIHKKNTHASPTIASDGKRLFVYFNNDESVFLTCMGLDGKILWQKRAGQFVPYYAFGFASSPTIWESTVIVAAESEKNGFLAAFDLKSGQEKWRQPRESTNYSSPIVGRIGDSFQVLLSGNNSVAGFDPKSGKQLWKAPTDWKVSCGTLVWAENRVFASGGFPKGQTVCVDAGQGGKVVWQNRVKCYEQSMLYHDGYLYAISDAGIGYCWDAKDGAEKWKVRMQGPVSSSPILAGGHIYYASERGVTYVFRATPEKFDLVAKNTLGNSAFATPAFCDHQIFARIARDENGRQEYLVCIGQKR